MKSSTKNRINTKAKIFGLQLLSVATVIVPIGIIVYSNLDRYVGVEPEKVVWETIKISSGGLVAIGISVAAIVGKLKLKLNWILLGILWGILWAIEPIIKDLVLFVGIAFGAMTFNHIFINGTLESLAMYGNIKTEGLIHAEAEEDVKNARLKAEAKNRAIAEAKALKKSRYRP